MNYQLGIDTGGTFTDAVIVDENGTLLASHKSLTTAFDLSQGINNVISALPTELLRHIDLVALSTTLSTNSVVEGRGAPVAVLLPGYEQKQIDKSGLYEIIAPERIVALTGGHDAMGVEHQSLNLSAIEQTIIEQNDKVSAFAVSAMFGTRNTTHEIAVRDCITRLTGKPVACGHELASSLGAPRRALTAALNARMIPFIKMLISSLETILHQQNIHAPLMIVKGDGSLINARTAELQPVATVLSGPAASVLGACTLSGRQNALVVDIGGTTTDIAVVHNGKADLCEDGARIGDWQPMVEAIRVCSIGLGGDSEVRFNGKMTISTRRVVPVSLLVHQHPHLLKNLEQQLNSLSNPRHNRFAQRLQFNDALVAQLTPVEKQAWDLLADGPVDIDRMAEKNRPLTRALARLERMGLVIYSGFTPSDATHVLGMSAHWNRDAAVAAATLWARQMRYLYGCGDWSLDDATGPSEAVFKLVTEQLSRKLIEAGLNQHGLLNEARSRNMAGLLAELILANSPSEAHQEVLEQPIDHTLAQDKNSATSSTTLFSTVSENTGNADQQPNLKPSLFNLQFAKGYPLVAVGGPAPDFFPSVAKQLGMELILPEHANTANALGAVMAKVVQSVRVSVTQPSFGTFCVFYGNSPSRFDTLAEALEHAETIALAAAIEQAASSGAQAIESCLQESREHVDHDIDGELFISATITAIASGKPKRASH